MNLAPMRSALFVPAHKPWARKAVDSGADAVILDLEDAVPEDQKVAARAGLREAVSSIRDADAAPVVLVRPNALDSNHYASDVEAAVVERVDALLLPKLFGADDVREFEAVVRCFEVMHAVPQGSVALVPSLETARAIRDCTQIMTASDRIVSVLVAAARDSDVSREVGFTWTPEGLETLQYRTAAIVASRAAGIDAPMVGLWQELTDLDGLGRFALQNSQLGFRGQVVIHPSHVAVVNEAYTPPGHVLERYRRMVAAFEVGQEAGSAAVTFEGEHIDIAHVKTARTILARFDHA
ncbi:MAG: CoA ester lyase [Acidimicrobiales bacterium]